MRWWPLRRHPYPVLDRSVEQTTAKAMETVDEALAELRAVLVDALAMAHDEGRHERRPDT